MTSSPIRLVGMPYVPGWARGRLQHGTRQLAADTILILSQEEIIPFRTAPAGLVIEEGAPLSHTMISLLGGGIPTVILSARQVSRLEVDREVLLDGSTGLLTTDLAAAAAQPAAARPAAGQALLSADGVAVSLRASVRSVAAARQAALNGAEAIGLVRSEFLQPGGDALPGTAFYRHTFSELCEAAAPLPVTIRLLDLAADKMPGWMPAIEGAGVALGLQGTRLYGFEPVRSAFHAQLAALDAVCEDFDIRLLIPYLVRFEELRYWTDYIRRRMSKPLRMGAMVETPAGALDLANWFELVEFVSLGCNDLMQCLFAADRDRPELRHYLDPYAPLLFRFLRQVADSAGAHLQRIQLCGLLPQLQGVLPILLGLGYRAFSVDTALLPHLAGIVRTTRVCDARTLAAAACAAAESRQVTEMAGIEGAREPFLKPVLT